MNKNSFLRRYYAFNLYNRDLWMQKQAKKIKDGLMVLDIGAGSAPYRPFFSHCNYTTQDFGQLKDNQLRGLKGYNKIDIVSDIVNIPVEDNSFDVVICTEVIEHIPFPIQAVHEFSRILKKDGILLLTAPLGSGIHQEPFHFYGGFTPYWYEKFLIENGFKILELEPNMGFYSYFSQEFIRFMLRTAPWKKLFNLTVLPIWIMLLPFSLLLPLLSPLLDKYDSHKDFTIDYHVVAAKTK